MKADPTTTCRPAAGSGWVDQRVPEQCWTPANRPVKPNLRPGASLAGRRRSNADADERAGSVAGSRAGDPDRRSSYAPYGTRKRLVPPSPLSLSGPLLSSRALSVASAATSARRASEPVGPHLEERRPPRGTAAAEHEADRPVRLHLHAPSRPAVEGAQHEPVRFHDGGLEALARGRRR